MCCLPRRAGARTCLHILLCLALGAGHLASDSHAAESAVILMYHHVSDQTPPSTSISPAGFREQMAYLDENGFRILPLEQVIARLQQGQSLPDKAAVITFDDGYLSVYEEAFPVLQDYDWPFTVFITAGLVSSNSRLYASWEQLREMGDAGATLANHTLSHAYLLDRNSDTDEADWLAGVRQEIEGAEAKILAETGQSHRLLAYPYGEYNPAIQALVTELGYVAFGQHSGAINRYADFTALPRFPFGGNFVGMNSYRTKVNSLAFSVMERAPSSPVTRQNSPEVFLRFEPAQQNLSCFNSDEAIQVQAENGGYRISTHIDNRGRRFRYNCTAPGPGGRFYWYTVDWVNPDIPE